MGRGQNGHQRTLASAGDTRPVLSLYDTLTRTRQPLLPSDGKTVRIYDCGPTVYSAPHVGNMYRYIVSDVVRRTLERFGYAVRQVMNITDVGHMVGDADDGIDKITLAAQREHKDPASIAAFYTELFFKDSARLNIQRPHIVCPASQYIPLMLVLINEILENGYAYVAADGVYFRVRKWGRTGKLSGRELTQLRPGERVEINPNKEDPFDFALWRGEKPGDLQVWDSPWGRGNPGWHAECSALGAYFLNSEITDSERSDRPDLIDYSSEDFSKDGFDAHSGGEDNLFPHHECELAQAEAAGHKFARQWLHVRFLQIKRELDETDKPNSSDGEAVAEKMSKSKGMVYTIDDLEKKGISPLAFRLFSLQSSYGVPSTLSLKDLRAQQVRLERWYTRIASVAANVTPAPDLDPVLVAPFLAALADNLNTAKALAQVEVLITQLADSDPERVAQALTALYDADRVLALGFSSAQVKTVVLTAAEVELCQEREDARTRGDFQHSDALRSELAALGLEVKDTQSGPIYRRV